MLVHWHCQGYQLSSSDTKSESPNHYHKLKPRRSLLVLKEDFGDLRRGSIIPQKELENLYFNTGRVGGFKEGLTDVRLFIDFLLIERNKII